MIAYFSGTGNSKNIALKIQEKIQEEIIDINEKIKSNNTDDIEVKGNLILVTPTYAWRIPRIVKDWILKTNFKGVNNIRYIMTCGDSNGNADKYNIKISEEKGFTHMGTKKIVMPENYIAMFDAPGKDKAKEIIAKAELEIENIINTISSEKPFENISPKISDKFISGPVNSIFYSFFVKSKNFYAKDNCIGCGKCEKLCPLNNINMKDKRPKWGKACTHCMACMNYCPVEAIEYGKKSEGKFRYTLEKCANIDEK